MITTDTIFSGRRLLIAAKEAGAGSLLAALSRQWRPATGSIAMAACTAIPYFAGLPIQICSVADDPAAFSDDALIALIHEVKPEGIVVGASAGRSIEKRLMRAAQAMGLQVHAFIDHYWNLWQRFADEDTARRWAYLPDHIYVPAGLCLTRMVEADYPAARISIFEHPLLHAAAGAVAPEVGQELRRSLGISPDAFVVLFVSEYVLPPDPLWKWEQPLREDVSGLLELLLRISAQTSPGGKKIYILIKPHPAESADWAVICGAVEGARWRVAGDVGKSALFSVSDMAFGLNSMLLIEAAAAGVPSFSCHIHETRSDMWLSSLRPEITELADAAACQSVIEQAANVAAG